MCDYSLEYIASRPAVVSDRLVSTSFHNTTTRGFAGADDVNTAVCLRPGTELAFEMQPVFEHPVTHQETIATGKVAKFRQINPNISFTHHDALELPDGTLIPLTCLLKGQYATVLQLPAEGQPQVQEKQAAEVVL
jgi:hypothetical protein